MAGKNGRLSEAELLGGSDDDETTTSNDALDTLDGGDDDLTNELTSDDTGKGHTLDQDAGADDGLEVIILDSDEGQDGQRAGEGDDTTQAGEYDDPNDDTGEVLGEDLLTADERKHYSKSVAKRIGRERKLKIEERARADAAERDLIKANTENLELRKGFSALLVAQLERDVAMKAAELEKAMEDGNSKEQVKLQGELDDLRAQRRGAVETKERLDKMKAPDAAAPARNPTADRWVARNPWFQNPKFTAQHAAARSVDAQLAQEVKDGKFRHGQGSPEYFVELDRRLHREMPGLKTQINAEYGGSRPKARVAAPAGRGAARPAVAGRGKVYLTKDDLANMEQFGLNTKDPKVLKEYALNKQTGGSFNGR